MYPSDNSVIKTVKWEIGNKIIGRSTIIKDNFTFGMKEARNFTNSQSGYHTRENREKIINDIRPGNEGGELWCTLGNPNVKLFVENVFDDREDCSGASAIITYQEGLVVQFLPSMEVVQTRTDEQRIYKQKVVDLAHDVKDDSEIEVKRIITKNGTVIRYMKNGNIQLLFVNGNYSMFNSKANTWEKTNNDCQRSLHKLDPETGKVISITELEPLVGNSNIDPETNQEVFIRSDGMMKINYNDGSTLVLHQDNTKILRKPDTENYDIFIGKFKIFRK